MSDLEDRLDGAVALVGLNRPDALDGLTVRHQFVPPQQPVATAGLIGENSPTADHCTVAELSTRCTSFGSSRGQ